MLARCIFTSSSHVVKREIQLTIVGVLGKESPERSFWLSVSTTTKWRSQESEGGGGRDGKGVGAI